MISRATRIVRVDADDPDPLVMAEAGALLRNGGLVAFPTETVYGLGANALDAAAVRAIFAAKQRPAGDPLIVHIARADQLSLVAVANERAAMLARRFWPGPLTLVLPKTGAVPREVTAGLPGVAVRMPAHPVARSLIDAAGVPVAAPSANLFSRPSPTLASHVADDLSGRIDLILDGGPTRVGLESTVLDLQGDPPRVLRPGAVSIEALREAISTVAGPLPQEQQDEQQSLLSPGTLIKHYSPRAEVLLFEGAAAVGAEMKSMIEERVGAGQKVGLLLCDEDLAGLSSVSSILSAGLGTCRDLEGVARRLFAGMRELDAAGAEVIFARLPEGGGIALAIGDRLRRAAEGRVIRVQGG